MNRFPEGKLQGSVRGMGCTEPRVAWSHSVPRDVPVHVPRMEDPRAATPRGVRPAHRTLGGAEAAGRLINAAPSDASTAGKNPLRAELAYDEAPQQDPIRFTSRARPR